MSSYKEHVSECYKRLGKGWECVHRWLDENFVKCGFSARHREFHHHLKGIEEARKRWGDQAAEAARIHIEMDFDGWVPADEQEVEKWFFGVIQVPPGWEYKEGKLVKIDPASKTDEPAV